MITVTRTGTSVTQLFATGHNQDHGEKYMYPTNELRTRITLLTSHICAIGMKDEKILNKGMVSMVHIQTTMTLVIMARICEADK